MPDADAISQDAADDVAREESGTEHAPSVPPPAVADTSMELHGNDLKRQQPEPWDPPDQGSHERPLKRLRKLNTAEEAASLTVPSSLEDSLGEGSNHRAGAAAVEANHESAEERREQAEKEGGDPGLDVMGVEQEGEQEEGEQDSNEAPPDNRANDTICTKCDDGGDLILCDGNCMRAFHAGIRRKEEGAEGPEIMDDAGSCNPLGIGAELFMNFSVNNDKFLCPHCKNHKQQCFACKEEGSADREDPHREVFKCTVGTCGRFYHAKCLDKDPEEMASFFVCPSHICKRCNEGETEEKGIVIPCRRCPVSYHVNCLPKKILNSPVTRVWISKKDIEEKRLHPPVPPSKAVEPECEIQQSLLYCMRHEMAVGDATPAHKVALFSKPLRRTWAKHYAETYPDLRWSRDVMEKFAEIRAAAERRRRQAAQEAQAAKAAKAVPKPPAAVTKATVSKGAASAGAAAAAVPRRPKSARPKQAEAPAAAPARKAATLTSDDDEIPLAARIAAAKKKRPAKPAKPPPTVAEAESFIPFEDTPADSAPAIRVPSPVRPSQKQSASASRQSAQDRAASAADAKGEASAASVQVEAVWTEHTVEQGLEPSPAVPAALPDLLEGVAEPFPRLQSEEIAAEETPTPSPRAEAAADQPEDDMWAADADEEVEEADGEAAQATEEAAVQPDAAAAAAEAEAARAAQEAAAAAAAALEEEESFLLPCERESHWTKGAVQQRLNAWWGEAEYLNPLSEVQANARMPKPYDSNTRGTIARDRLDGYVNTVKHAVKNPLQAKLLIDAKFVKEMYTAEDTLRMVLAPVLHGGSYTSYGRHFTLPPLLAEVNTFLLPFLDHGDTVVDFSCGYNVWLPMLKRQCLAEGFEVKGRAFDIITAKDVEDFEKNSWMDVKAGRLPRGDRLVIGLNPPFGKDGCLADKFVSHAALQHQPRIIILIVPPATPIPQGYCLLLEDNSLMRGEAFFKPGVDKASWNDVTPATRILVRKDYFPQALERLNAHTRVLATHTFPYLKVPQVPMYGQMALLMGQMGPPMFNAQQAF